MKKEDDSSPAGEDLLAVSRRRVLFKPNRHLLGVRQHRHHGSLTCRVPLELACLPGQIAAE
ncbi:hypothetical protein [Accumulibacter sp.]|uniref:Uncharacterized protein n=1 Tax=Accumulibacter regalis TaxID=522306 RepID=C7RP89_ACCRE|nr:hypothetical protein [Accumulibacter sp.]MBN8496457.1 hypothetical protein [Accumulibacter sp.]MBO3717328.1 hypothetical protein [Accumulibacter sp.]